MTAYVETDVERAVRGLREHLEAQREKDREFDRNMNSARDSDVSRLDKKVSALAQDVESIRKLVQDLMLALVRR